MGNSKLIVFVVHDTKLVKLFAVPDGEAITVARCMYVFCSGGRYKGFASDPGSNITAEVIQQLNEWLDMFHKVSLVDRHESCGVEHTNRVVLEHARALVQTERAEFFWDQPEYLQTVENIINRYSDWETGLSPNELTFGSEQMVYYTLLDPMKNLEDKHEYLRKLNEYLRVAREESELFHKKIIERRAKENVDGDMVMRYQPGDLILFKPNPRSKAHKLVPTNLGPYRVHSQERSEILCHQVATCVARQFHITRVYPFTGSEEEAFELACRDSHQYGVIEVLGYRGDPVSARRYMTFLVRFADEDISWIQYGPGLISNAVYQNFVDSIPELALLKYTALEAGRYIAHTRKLMIPTKLTPSRFLIDIRVLGFTWYDSLNLPDADTSLYVMHAEFVKYTNKPKSRAEVFIPVLQEKLSNLDYSWFELNATRTTIPEKAILIDEQFLVKFPSILGSKSKRQQELERKYSPVLAGTPANRRGIFRTTADDPDDSARVPLLESREHRRINADDHIPTIRDGHTESVQRSILQRSESVERKLVAPVTSRKYSKDIPEVNTGVRTSLRRLNKN
jgi:hypothetical protein